MSPRTYTRYRDALTERFVGETCRGISHQDYGGRPYVVWESTVEDRRGEILHGWSDQEGITQRDAELALMEADLFWSAEKVFNIPLCRQYNQRAAPLPSIEEPKS